MKIYVRTRNKPDSDVFPSFLELCSFRVVLSATITKIEISFTTPATWKSRHTVSAVTALRLCDVSAFAWLGDFRSLCMKMFTFVCEWGLEMKTAQGELDVAFRYRARGDNICIRDALLFVVCLCASVRLCACTSLPVWAPLHSVSPNRPQRFGGHPAGREGDFWVFSGTGSINRIRVF